LLGLSPLGFFPDSPRLGHAGAGFDLRFSLSRNAKWAFLAGEGPRTFGFFMSMFAECRSTTELAQLAHPSFIG